MSNDNCLQISLQWFFRPTDSVPHFVGKYGGDWYIHFENWLKTNHKIEVEKIGHIKGDGIALFWRNKKKNLCHAVAVCNDKIVCNPGNKKLFNLRYYIRFKHIL